MPTTPWRVNAQKRRAKPTYCGLYPPQGQDVDRSQAHHLSFRDGADSAGRPTAIRCRGNDVQGSQRNGPRRQRAQPARVDGRRASARRAARSDELAARLAKVESEHEELKRVATEVEARLERGDGIHPVAAGCRPVVAQILVSPQPGSASHADVADCSPLRRRIRRNKQEKRKMPQVSVQIANRTYDLACGEGEEARVQELAAYVEEKVTELRRQLPADARIQAAGVRLAAAGRGKPRGARCRQGGRERPARPHRTAPRRWPRRSEELITAPRRQDVEEGVRRRVRRIRHSGGARQSLLRRSRPEVPLRLGRGAEFCAVRGSLKTPGPIRTPGNCSWP